MLGSGGFETWEGDGPEQLAIEQDAPADWETGLTERGHQVHRSRNTPDHRFGHAQVVMVDDGVLHGAADPRALIGAATGY
jgi:gamma-glutamyltranspeptidase/glutathione hydrolase